MQKFDNYINGEWVKADQYEPNINPSDVNDVVGEYAKASESQAMAAIDAANEAADGWANSTPQERFNALDFIGTEILANAQTLGDLLSREEGKTLAEGVGEAMRAGQIFKFFAGEALRLNGDLVPSVRPDIDVEVTRTPVGVVGLITPWNFPIAIPAWKIAPALAYGNAVVFKPAELVNGSAWALVEIISRAPLPKGVMNLVMGPGRVIGEVMSNSKDIDALSFTGSVPTGEHIRKNVVANGGKIQLEMGGKNPLIVLKDADMDVAVNCAVQGAFFSTGQRCTASSRLIVEDAIYDEFCAKMVEELTKLKIGDARDTSVQIGPVSSKSQLESNLEYVSIAKNEGGEVIFGDNQASASDAGFFMDPVLIKDTTSNMRINQEEVFGPVASIIKVSDYDEAIKVANDVEFGLCAGICTNSLKYARSFKRQSKSGMVMVNLPTAGVDYHVPFGGVKGSSYGSREQGSYAKEFYTNVKTAYSFAP